jgi:hypothetical protein
MWSRELYFASTTSNTAIADYIVCTIPCFASGFCRYAKFSSSHGRNPGPLSVDDSGAPGHLDHPEPSNSQTNSLTGSRSNPRGALHRAGLNSANDCLFRRPEFLGGEKRNGAPEKIRTSDLQLRRLPLYPAELRARSLSVARHAAQKRRKIPSHLANGRPSQS